MITKCIGSGYYIMHHYCKMQLKRAAMITPTAQTSWTFTYAGSEMRGVNFRVVLVLHGVINAVALPHQVVVPAQNGGIDFGQFYI